MSFSSRTTIVCAPQNGYIHFLRGITNPQRMNAGLNLRAAKIRIDWNIFRRFVTCQSPFKVFPRQPKGNPRPFAKLQLKFVWLAFLCEHTPGREA